MSIFTDQLENNQEKMVGKLSGFSANSDIKYLRRMLDLSQIEFACLMGVSTEVISKMENRRAVCIQHEAIIVVSLYDLLDNPKIHRQPDIVQAIQRNIDRLRVNIRKNRVDINIEFKSPSDKQIDPRFKDIEMADLDLTVRAYNVLFKKGCRTVYDVIDRLRDLEALKYSGFGKRSLEDVIHCLTKIGALEP